MQRPLTCVEICAGAGGQALGLAMAGFVHVALVEYERDYCKVLKDNRPEWNVICADVHSFDGRPYKGVDLLAGGVPCPPFSVAGKQLGKDDERDLFPEAIRLIREIRPRAVMLENVRGFLDSGFEEYRDHIVNDTVCRYADLREKNGGKAILHASVSAKWTMRSDRAQNSRTEALNLIRNRKGHLPHIVVVTGEPLPSRIASLALGTGDIDCVYHFALPELIASVNSTERADVIETLKTLVEGKRLKDISDLPLDLSV